MIMKTDSQEETFNLGKRIGALLRDGDVVLLSGEMGTGKSVLARGMASGLGVAGPVPSPSFTILNVYDARKGSFYHFDFYRLSGVQELYEAGLDEYIPASDGVVAIEWPEMAPEALPKDAIRIHIDAAGEERRIRIDDGALTAALLTSDPAGKEKGEESVDHSAS